MTTHAPRPYQLDLEQRIYAAWAGGARNVIAVLPTGAGKSYVTARVVSATAGAVCVIAHRSELVSQMSVALAREGVAHRVIGPESLRRLVTQMHMREFRRSFYDPNARVAVAGVNTLVNRTDDPFLAQVALWVQDEAHHVLADNTWGRAAAMFPNARGLGVTATPCRADGKGLGRHADGLMDVMVIGPTMRELIEQGFLTEYRVLAPASSIDLSNVPVTGSGDYSPERLKQARQRSTITGDVVKHYLKWASGKLGVVFDTDIENATETTAAFRDAGIRAELITGKTADLVRAETLQRFRDREIQVLVNVDLFGEGFDLPALEVVQFARPTQSYGLYCLDPKTEVLTPRGWLSADDALGAEEVIAFNLATGACEVTSVTGRVARAPYANERMFGVTSPHLDICVSDEHTMLARSSGKGWVRETAAETSARRGMFRVPVAGRGRFPGSNLSVSELRFLGWFLSDGSRSKHNGAITITQSAAKTRHIQSITDALTGGRFKFGVHLAARQGEFEGLPASVLFTVSKGTPRGRGRGVLRGYEDLAEWCDKSIPSRYDALTRDELLVLLETLNLGDGWNQHACADWTPRTLRIACGTNRVMADRLQALCVTRGLRCNISTDFRPSGSEWHTAYIKDVDYSTVAGQGTRDGSVSGKKPYARSRFEERSERPAFVWCLSNDLGTLITRRNGKVAIVGNCQQFGRALRPSPGKDRAMIIDHVGNVARHGLPDAAREWSLDRRDRASRSAPADVIPLRTCLNPECLAVYERVLTECPYCGHAPVPAARSAPEFVDGDLVELDPEVLAALRGEAARLLGPVFAPVNATPEVRGAITKRHNERRSAQVSLQVVMAIWGGWQTFHLGRSEREAQRRFFHAFGTDVATAHTLSASEATVLAERVQQTLDREHVVMKGSEND